MIYVLIILVFGADGFMLKPAAAFPDIESCASVASLVIGDNFVKCEAIDASQVPTALKGGPL